jgi:hypothetical protein
MSLLLYSTPVSSIILNTLISPSVSTLLGQHCSVFNAPFYTCLSL